MDLERHSSFSSLRSLGKYNHKTPHTSADLKEEECGRDLTLGYHKAELRLLEGFSY